MPAIDKEFSSCNLVPVVVHEMLIALAHYLVSTQALRALGLQEIGFAVVIRNCGETGFSAGKGPALIIMCPSMPNCVWCTTC